MEAWDLYDKNRKKLNTTINRGDTVPHDCYHLAVKICIFNRQGEMLIQQRSNKKSDYPELWDLTACGSAVSGETSEIAAKRELEEEVGITIDGELKPFMTIYDKVCFFDIYILRKQVDIETLKLQEDEVKRVKWANKNEILNMIKNKEFIPCNTYQRDMSLLIEMIFQEFSI